MSERVGELSKRRVPERERYEEKEHVNKYLGDELGEAVCVSVVRVHTHTIPVYISLVTLGQR